MPRIRVLIEGRAGPPVEAYVEAKNPKTAIREALDQHPGPGIATVGGTHLVGRRFASGLITITTNVNKENTK